MKHLKRILSKCFTEVSDGSKAFEICKEKDFQYKDSDLVEQVGIADHDGKDRTSEENALNRKCEILIPINFRALNTSILLEILDVVNFHLAIEGPSKFGNKDIVSFVKFMLLDEVDELFREYDSFRETDLSVEEIDKKRSVIGSLQRIRTMFSSGIDDLYIFKGNFESKLHMLEWLMQAQ